jgi:abequosyltransferase
MPAISVCIPAYSRKEFLPPLLESILLQDSDDYEVIVAEDMSPQRAEIAAICNHYSSLFDGRLRLILNDINLGYDKNLKSLVRASRGRFCLFMGNDDLMAPNALREIINSISAYPDATYFLRAYRWFHGSPVHPSYYQDIHYYYKSHEFRGDSAFAIGIRRAGILSGFTIRRDVALSAETDIYDGGLYYQIYLACCALAVGTLFYCNEVLTFSRASIPPEFGSAQDEAATFTPGCYTGEARLHMLTTVVRIVNDVCTLRQKHLILKDYSRHFYPYISDLLQLPFVKYANFISKMALLGFWKFPEFYFYAVFSYLLKPKAVDAIFFALRKLRDNFFYLRRHLSK